MRYVKNTVVLMLCLLCINAQAGVTAITYHSRANCGGFNESISWRLGYSYWFQTLSQHIHSVNGTQMGHFLDSGSALTWRSAAYHATEGYGGWTVVGTHYFYNDSLKRWTSLVTQATDCSIYDGWWDH